MIALFERVEDLHLHCAKLASKKATQKEKERVWRSQFNECGLSQFICQYGLRFYTDSLEVQSRVMRMSRSHGLLSHGVVVECIDKFASDLKQTGEHFQNEWRVSKNGVHNHTEGGPSEIRKTK